MMIFTIDYDFYTYLSVKKESDPKLGHVRKCGQEHMLKTLASEFLPDKH